MRRVPGEEGPGPFSGAEAKASTQRGTWCGIVRCRKDATSAIHDCASPSFGGADDGRCPIPSPHSVAPPPTMGVLFCPFAGGRSHHYFATRRFDRKGAKRLHAHSASGLLYADFRLPSLDYKDLIALTRAVTRDRREGRAMFALATFNVRSHNRDDHARQFTFLMSRDGKWRLAPAYDLTFAAGPGGEHTTSVLGRGKNIDRERLLALGRHADLKDREAREVIDCVAAAVADWHLFAARSPESAQFQVGIDRGCNLPALDAPGECGGAWWAGDAVEPSGAGRAAAEPLVACPK